MSNTAILSKRVNIVSRWCVNAISICVLSGVLIGCSSGPATQYYALFSDKNIQTLSPSIDQSLSLGIGPIILPEYIENPSIVSIGRSQQVSVSGYHAWAGELKESISRVLADNMSGMLGSDNVWSFPWDVRVRPRYQVRIEFLEFSGERGKDVNLKAKWTLVDHKTDAMLQLGREEFTLSMQGNSYNDYVATLNQLLHKMSASMGEKLHPTLLKL